MTSEVDAEILQFHCNLPRLPRGNDTIVQGNFIQATATARRYWAQAALLKVLMDPCQCDDSPCT